MFHLSSASSRAGMNKVVLWSEETVSVWLTDQGLQEYAEPLRNCDGAALLNLTADDFQRPPLSRVTSDGGRHLLEKMETLKMEHHIDAHKNGHANGHVVLSHDGNASKVLRNGAANGFHKELVKIAIPEATSPQFPAEWGKTAVALVYALFCFAMTTVIISVVHERVPPKEETPPLPDKFFDVFERVGWAFTVCEINGMILMILWIVQWSLLKHKSIVGRRFCFIVGTLYLYRCITMYVTTLPVPGLHFRCSPKVHGDWESQMRRVMKMIAGGGLTITGSHNLCGDYLYSGHTVMLTLTYLFMKEYSPRRFWWYHWGCWALCAVGVFCILLAHDHYTIDVVVAYFIATRLFWWYHTMANQQALKETAQTNFFTRVWWYRFFRYLEENVPGVVPRSFVKPFSWRSLQWGHVKYTRIDSD
ncbi:phosphatidylcholine:ceramide cholinephosphotransferase 1 [Triplophysa rosa]|uniref:Phosphatidylcholine:ceramide cholinephosphotransferase 1 n=1 Tax=Triplophysa rosa TaxID=992332 RepID=A0A9W7TH56_TRIRA|nr:phosphatidylcholine:ceramide cholinephosphotransferase 1 [Triplophysa rosa]XP_057214284.1 phosphatidylcholine:ceramide cholinephosphotransferase 1 [Triplophysa rosa]XP_057214285.1 phosphatidylcholine:ceramide cholinephosphotransferase 1 [Triplophysa rosa]XP_057214286.1 phosphatidylcholine:ceramide cholinephosphotransferase 1 [Triplophysa rosa]KAI7797247.1 phosphatidylcholine:ceramide cholinephosphotransferase 1 [Triplophysa rosa]